MRIIFLASGEFAVPTLQWLVQSSHDVAMVYTQPARAAGRGRKKAATPVGLSALSLGLAVHEVEDVNAPDVLAEIRSFDAELGLAIAFGQKLGPQLLSSLPQGCLNLHASLLPRYRGAAPINWAMARGEERTGCTVFRMNDRMDAGPVLTSCWTTIKPEETAGELHDRLACLGVDAVTNALTLIQSSDAAAAGKPQNDAQATKAPKLKKADGKIQFDRSTVSVVRHINSMTPWPGASTHFQSKDGRWEKVQIVRARRAEIAVGPTDPAGTINAAMHVATADAFVEILEIKPSSGRIMAWQDYVNGRRVKPGDKLGPIKP